MKLKLVAVAVLAATAATAQAGTVITKGDDIVLSTKGGLKLETADKKASFKVAGRLQWDYEVDSSDDASGAEVTDTDDFDVRRARLAFSGHVGDWGYKTQFNVAESGDGGGDAEDLYIRYKGFGKQANITIGKQKEPLGLEELTSSKDISALERSAVTEEYAQGRNAGIQLHGKGSNWTYGLGIFEADGNGGNDFENTGITGRVTYAPIKSTGQVVHLGAGFSTRDAEDSADELDVYNLELAGVFGAFHAQAEYYESEEGDVENDAFYVQAGYIVTGESRPYKDGKFKKVKGDGAVELVVRYEDGFAKYSDIDLATAEGEQLTLGANYYFNSNVRLGLSYMDGELDTGEEGNELRVRFQFTF